MAALLTALVAIAPLSTDMYLPALPTIGAHLSATTAEVQLTLSVYLIGFAVAQLIVGPLSDRLGRRPVLLGGAIVFVVMSIACLLSNTITLLIVARFFQAVGACTGAAVGRAVVRDIHDPKNAARLLAHMGSAMAIGPLVAPLIGGQLTAAFGWQSNFVFLAIIGSLLFVVASIMLPETHANPDRNALSPYRMAANYKQLVLNPHYQSFVLVSGFSFAGLFSFISGSSFVLIDSLGMSPETFGFAFAIPVLGYIVGTQLTARLIKTHDTVQLIGIGGRIGLIAGLAGVVSVWLVPASIAVVIVPMFFYSLSVGFVMPNSMAGALGPFPQMAGAASALMGFIQMALAASFGAVVGWVYDGTPLPMMMTIATCGLIAWAVSLRTKRL